MARVVGHSYAASGRSAAYAAPTRWGNVAAIAACAALLASYALASWTATLGKSAAAGEPSRVVAGWMQLARGDYRVNPQDPPLWKFLAARPNARFELRVDSHPKLWSVMLNDASESGRWARAVLYGGEGGAATADALLARSRVVMVAIAVLLGAMTGWWAWRIAGPTAAVVAVALFSLDPNFLAHGPLLDGDVAMSLALLAGVYAAWRAGRRASVFRITVVALFAALALSLKFSGLYVVAVIAAVVAARVFVPASWPLLGRWLRKWWGRYVVAGTVVLVMLAVAVAGLWATYGFRFRPAPDAQSAMNMPGIVAEVGAIDARLRSRGNMRLATQPVQKPGAVAAAVTFADANKLLPQAWLYGALDAYQGLMTRQAFALDQSRRGGWWWYFPFAIVAKAPLATLAALPLAAWALLRAWRRYGTPGEGGAWTITCLALPVVLYVFFAMLARLDFGLRHVLPIYPFVFVAIGVAAAVAVQRSPRAGWVVALLAIGLTAETARAYPHYVPFFNAAVTAWRPGARLLGESNVDLGQDLPLVAKWQVEHPERKLYLSYSGPADPALYAIKAIDVRKDELDLRPRWPADPAGVLAVSASRLQGFDIDPSSRLLYAQLRKREPTAILGGSIYLYELAAAAEAAAPAPK